MAHYGRQLSRQNKQELFLNERQLEVADRYFRKGETYETIAGDLEVSIATISKDVKAIKKEYSMKRMEKFQVYLNIMDQQFRLRS